MTYVDTDTFNTTGDRNKRVTESRPECICENFGAVLVTTQRRIFDTFCGGNGKCCSERKLVKTTLGPESRLRYL